jgi:hypothetical protein
VYLIVGKREKGVFDIRIDAFNARVDVVRVVPMTVERASNPIVTVNGRMKELGLFSGSPAARTRCVSSA